MLVIGSASRGNAFTAGPSCKSQGMSRTFIGGIHRYGDECSALCMAKNSSGTSKGFGAKPVPKVEDIPTVVTSTQDDVSPIPVQAVQMTAGQKALQKLRDERQAQKDEELRKVKMLQEQDNIFKENPDAAVIPEKVAMRMGKRMLPFVGLPIFGSMGAFVFFWYMATYQNQEFQPAVVAATTIGLLAFGLIGITYSVMSASWDPESDGSVLGVEEFNKNVDNLKEGLGRSRENAQLREKMKGLPESEIQAALRDLERREKKASKKSQTLEQKLNDEI